MVERLRRAARRALAAAPALALAAALTAAPTAALSAVAPGLGTAADGAPTPSGARVTFDVTAPVSTPADAVLWISGNIVELGGWNGAGLRLEPGGAKRYAVTVTLPAGAVVEFKVTRGSWDTVEKGPKGEEIANRTFVAKDADTVRVVVATWRDQTAGRATRKHTTRTGDVRLHAAFPSRFVEPRDVLVWLPPGYAADTTTRYPAAYFHDGNNMLDDSTSFAGEWRLDETAERLIGEHRVDPFIAVAVYNTPDRIAEYTPVADAKHGGGRAAEYARFLIEELKPFIDRTYRTQSDSAHTGIIGSSLGGLVSLSIAFDHPNVFGRVGAVSPSVGWGDGWIAHRAARAPRSLRVWLDIGTAESGTLVESQRDVAGVRAVRDSLLAAGLPGRAVHLDVVEGAHHNEAAWGARLGPILEFLFPGVALLPEIKD